MKTELEWLQEQLDWLIEYRFECWGFKANEIKARDHTAYLLKQKLEQRIEEIKENDVSTQSQ